MEDLQNEQMFHEQRQREEKPSLPSFFSLNSRENKYFLLGLAAGCIGILLLALPLFLGRVYQFDDLDNYHLPFRYFYSQCLKHGGNFTWIPNIFCGFYLHGEGQVGMLHPLHLFLYRVLPLGIAYNLELILSYPFMLAGMYLFLRRWKLPRDASMLGAFICTFSGFNILHYAHMNSIAVGAHIPWLLAAIDVLMRDSDSRKKRCAALGLVLLTASQLLLGHPTAFWLSAVTEIAYILLILSRRNLRPLAAAGIAKACGIAIGAIQLLPHWEAASDSERQANSLQALSWPSLRPMDLLQAVAPYFFNDIAFNGIPYELKIYNGALPLVLFLYLILRFRNISPWRRLAAGAIIMAVFSIIMALGQYGRLYRVQLMLPLVGLLRTPCRYVLLFHFVIGVGVAISFADLSNLVRHNNRLEWKKLLPLLIIPLLAALPFLLHILAKDSENLTLKWYFIMGRNRNLLLVFTGVGMVLSAPILAVSAARGKALALPAIIVLVAVDLFLYGITFIAQHRINSIEEIRNSLPALSERPEEYRIQSGDNIFIIKDARLAGGYASISPKRILEPLNENRLKLANAHSIVSKNTLLFQGTAYGMRLPEPFPRVRLVTEAVASEDPGKDIDGINLASTALVSEKIDLGNGVSGSASFETDKPGEITVAVDCASKQLLVLSESYHDGWTAAIDGKPARVLRVNGDFMGVVVDPGKHIVQFDFLPQSLILGAWISATGIIATLLLFFLSWKKWPI